MRQAILLKFSPAGPMVNTAGRWVVLASELNSVQLLYPRPLTSFQISSWVFHVSRPHKWRASLIFTSSFLTSTQTGLSAFPSITIPSHPAYLSIGANLPPKLPRVNHSIGEDWTPIPWTSVLEEAPGTSVPERGEVMTVTIFLGSNPLTALSLTRSQKIADPIPWPPTHCS